MEAGNVPEACVWVQVCMERLQREERNCGHGLNVGLVGMAVWVALAVQGTSGSRGALVQGGR